MPKSINLMPGELRKPGKIVFGEIPLNQYNRPFAEEMKRIPAEGMIHILRDMVLVREFETMLNEIKTAGSYMGVAYDYPGPAHLGIGQEAAAVGQAYLLGVEDHIFGSHRSHAEVLAKGFSAVRRLDEKGLQEIMEKFGGGKLLRLIPDYDKSSDGLRETGETFMILGTMAEIFGRDAGFNRGMGGSMHVFFPPFGIYPNNAIVGGAAPIATGAALYKRVNRKPGMVVLNIGDGSLACGPVWEAMVFGTMEQFKTLWDQDHRGGLPIIYTFVNNGYAMGGQPNGETMGMRELVRVAAGLNPEMMHAERVDGYNPLAVIDAYERKGCVIREKQGPVLIDLITYRLSGHSPSDASTYRSREEIKAWEEQNSIQAFNRELVEHRIVAANHLEELYSQVREKLKKILTWAIDDRRCPRIDLVSRPNAIGEMMFSNQTADRMGEGEPDVLLKKEENPRLRKIAQKSRSGIRDGAVLPKGKAVQYRDAIFEAVLDGFYRDPSLIAYGEENREWGGAFAVYQGLTEALPFHRLFNSPIAEAAIAGTAVGYGLSGGRVICEIMYSDFLGRCGDEVFNQLAKWQAMSAGLLKMPVVVRISVGSKYGAQHSQDWTSMVAHVPGLKVVYPATPYDAKGLMNSALRGTDPVIFFESQRLYDTTELFHPGGVPEGFYEIPIGMPDVKREGKDITMLTIGAALYPAVTAADLLRSRYQLEAEIIDARSLVPFDYAPILESVEKTGRIVLVADACQRGSYANTLAQNIGEMVFDKLDAPPLVIGARNWITPPYEMEKEFFPQPEWILDAIHERILPLQGHRPLFNFTVQEKKRLEKLGE